MAISRISTKALWLEITALARLRTARRGRRRQPLAPMTLSTERLESRLALAGHTVIVYTAGFGGSTFPQGVINHVNDLINQGRAEDIQRIFTNWNSPNFYDPNTPSGNPGTFPSATDLLLGASSATAAAAIIVKSAGQPFTDESFVNSLSNKLENEYDDADTIILIGHSFGGDSLLKVANRLQGVRQIDVLATLDPVGRGGIRGNLPNPGNNVKYFFNRWQDILPFPFDFSTSGQLASSATGSTQNDFQVADQAPQSTRRLADGSPDWHGPDALETLFGVPLNGAYNRVRFVPTEVLPHVFIPVPTIEVKSLTHQYLPLDEYITVQLNRVLDGVIPQAPIIEATVSPTGTIDEGMTVRIDASRSYDPNVGQSIQGFEWSVSDPRVQVKQGSLDLSLAIGDNFTAADPLVVTLTAWDGPRFASGTKTSYRDFPIVSRNLAPSNVVIQGPRRYVRGFDVPLTATFDDPGFLDNHTSTWSVAGSTSAPQIVTDVPQDGTSDATKAASRGAFAWPLYEAAGDYTVGVSISDDDGGVGRSNPATLTIDVVGLVVDPYDKSRQDLLVGGSTGADTIGIRPGAANGTVVVDVNGQEYGPYALNPGDVVWVHGQGGDDRVQVGAGDLSRLPYLIHIDGQDGIDRIILDDSARTADVNYRIDQSGVKESQGSLLANSTAIRFGGLIYSGTEYLDLLGTAGANVFDVQPGFGTRYLIDGGLPTSGSVLSGNGDFLRLDTKTDFPASPNGTDTSGRRLSVVARGSGTWTFAAKTGRQPVDFRSIERFNHVDIIAAASDAGVNSSAKVLVFDAETLTPLFTIDAAATYGAAYRQGVRVATGDLDNDGLPDVAVAPGRLAAPTIKVFNGSPQVGIQGTEIVNLRIKAAATYGAGYLGGVNIAVGDVTGDTLNDIVLTPSRGKAIVKVFENSLVAGTPYARFGQSAARSFDAFPEQATYIGGASVATGDVKGIGKKQVVVGSGVGMTGNVRVFDLRIPASAYKPIMKIIDPTLPANRGGLSVTTGDLDGDGHDDIVTGTGAGSGGWVRAYSGQTGRLAFSVATESPHSATLPTRVAVRAVDGDHRMAVFATWGPDARQGYRTRRIDAQSHAVVDELKVPSSGFSGGGLNIG